MADSDVHDDSFHSIPPREMSLNTTLSPSELDPPITVNIDHDGGSGGGSNAAGPPQTGERIIGEGALETITINTPDPEVDNDADDVVLPTPLADGTLSHINLSEQSSSKEENSMGFDPADDQVEVGSIPSALSPESVPPTTPLPLASPQPAPSPLPAPSPTTPLSTPLPHEDGKNTEGVSMTQSLQSISLAEASSQYSILGGSQVSLEQGHSLNTTPSPQPLPQLSLHSDNKDVHLSDVVEVPSAPTISPNPEGFYNAPCFDQDINYSDSLSDENCIDGDLWPPTPETLALIAKFKSQKIDPANLTQAKPSNSAPFVSPVVDLVVKYHGEGALPRVTAPSLPTAESNLKTLLKEGRLLSAVNMLTDLLSNTELTPKTVKLWSLRFVLLTKLKLFSTLEVEMAAFGNLTNCDMYHEYHSTGMKGSIIPWSLRLVWSILPLHCPTLGGLYASLDRMYDLVFHLDHAIVAGLPYAKEERVTQYKINMLIQISGVLAGSGSYQPAIKVLDQIRAIQPGISAKVTCAMIRLYYQVGNIYKGECLFASVKNLLSEEELEMSMGFKAIANGDYKEAYTCFARALNINPSNTVANINAAVCLLYLGKLGDSIIQFEGATKASLHPTLVFNLVGLYELKTVASTAKKYQILDLILNNSDWEMFPYEYLRL